MSKKNRIVTFDEYGAWIDKIPESDIPLFINREHENIFVNPDLKHLNGVPTMFWKIENGNIVEMSRPEKLIMLDRVAKSDGVRPDQQFIKYVDKIIEVEKIIYKISIKSIVLSSLTGVILGFCLNLILKI